MQLKSFAAAVAILAMTATLALAQSPPVKGWTPKAPAEAGTVPPPPPPPEATPPAAATPEPPAPKTITRGAEDPPPAPPVAAPPAGAAPTPPPPPGGGGFAWLEATNPGALAEAMQSSGYRAELTTDDDGDPMIIGTASRSTYWIRFLDCDTPAGCLAVGFYVSYELQRLPELEAINQFNNDFRYIRAAMDPWEQPTMFMDVLMRDGGISRDAFLEYVRLWHAIVPEFENVIGF